MSEAQRDGEVNRVAVAELADVGGGPTMEPQEETKQSGRTVTCCASVTLPDGIDGEALQCQFDCGSFKSVPAVYSGGRVVCRVPADEDIGPKFKLTTSDGVVLLEDVLASTVEPLLAASDKPKDDEEATEKKAGDNGRAESRVESMKKKYSALKPFVIISTSYLLFTVTDGAVRMIVLLHAYNLGFSAFETALLFTLYELAGVVTNLLAGVAGARWGIRATLLTGLSLQILGFAMLMGWQESWSLPDNRWKGMLYAIIAQMWSGIAKDLTKLGGKTVTKLVTPDEKQSKLFKLVSFITGFKNSLKGLGYFLGSALVAVNYYMALAVMMGLVVLAMPWAAFGLSKNLGQTRKENITLKAIFKQNQKINWLSAARFFLFGSRDLWFEVPLPYFLRDTLFGVGLSRTAVGIYLAVWIIVYGQVQSWSPQLFLSPLKQGPPHTTNKFVGALWSAILMVCPLYMAIVILGTDIFYPGSEFGIKFGSMTVGLVAFCIIFAINSSVHSYLIVRYSEGNKVAMNVGFYYMSNAAGRLTGTIVSGALYSFAGGMYGYEVSGEQTCNGLADGAVCIVPNVTAGFGWCFVASCCFIVFSTLLMFPIQDNEGGLSCGLLACCGAQDTDPHEITDVEAAPEKAP